MDLEPAKPPDPHHAATRHSPTAGTDHSAAHPTGYCAPNRCYCGDPSCRAYATYGLPEHSDRHHAPTDSVLGHALRYASRRWPVFVLSPTKTPLRLCDRCRAEHTTPAQMQACQCLTCHGFHAATTRPGRITAMVERHPRGLLAMRTGLISRTVVVDVDPPQGLATLPVLDEAGLLPGTLMQMTGRDRGFQMFYAHPGGRITSRPAALGPGVDVRADDAYVVLPPSRHPTTGRLYRWSGNGRWDVPLTPLHPTLAEVLQAQPPGKAEPFRHSARPAGTTNALARLGGLAAKVQSTPQGQRNWLVFWAACRAADMIARGELRQDTVQSVLLAAATDAGLPAAEARRTIASGLRTRAQ